MAEPLILHMETATDICSVALSEGDRQLSMAESGPERSHATLLNPFIRKVMSESGRKLEELDGIAISKGPGSYTGLRIGVSTAKGIAFALEKPLLAIGTLESMAFGALINPNIQELKQRFGESLLLCPMLDARRMEVYAAIFSSNLKEFRKTSADIVDAHSYRDLLEKYQICFFGNGADKCVEIINHEQAHFVTGYQPSAPHMILPVLKRYMQQEFEDVAYFEPFYLKDFIATTPRKKLL